MTSQSKRNFIIPGSLTDSKLMHLIEQIMDAGYEVRLQKDVDQDRSLSKALAEVVQEPPAGKPTKKQRVKGITLTQIVAEMLNENGPMSFADIVSSVVKRGYSANSTGPTVGRLAKDGHVVIDRATGMVSLTRKRKAKIKLVKRAKGKAKAKAKTTKKRRHQTPGTTAGQVITEFVNSRQEPVEMKTLKRHLVDLGYSPNSTDAQVAKLVAKGTINRVSRGLLASTAYTH